MGTVGIRLGKEEWSERAWGETTKNGGHLAVYGKLSTGFVLRTVKENLLGA